MVDIEQRSLRAFEKHRFTPIQRTVDHKPRVRYVFPEHACLLSGLFSYLVDIPTYDPTGDNYEIRTQIRYAYPEGSFPSGPVLGWMTKVYEDWKKRGLERRSPFQAQVISQRGLS